MKMSSKNFRGLFDLKGKVAAVTGGAGGIGRDLILGLGQYGCDVVLLDIDTSKAEYLTEDFEEMGRKIEFVDMDVTSSSSVGSAFKTIIEKFGRLDILVNAAGINKRVPTVEFAEEDWDRIVDINLKGTFLCSKEAGKVMKEQNSGKIINFGSVSSILGHPKHSAYAASKGGVLLLTRVMAVELAKHKVNVNCVGPAYIETDLTKAYLDQENHREEIENTIPMGRLGNTEDMVGAIIYLASNASNFVSGALLMVDGARTAD